MRANAAPYTEEFKECVALRAQYIYDTYGRFSATVQNVFSFFVFVGTSFRSGLLR